MTNLTHKLKQIKDEYRNCPMISNQQRNLVLLDLADLVEKSTHEILESNQKDLKQMPLLDPKYDRLKLTDARIKDIANDLRKVAELPSPLNQILEEKMVRSGLGLQKISVPLGMIGIIYEARPNVSIDVFSLCFKAGNACILKGGSEAYASNKILVSKIHEVLLKHKLNPNLVFLMPPEREYVHDLLNAVGVVDVCIPRGSQGLIKFVRENAKIPVIETGAGIVHTYFDISGDIEKGAAIVNNAKTRRVSVCNALDTLIIHRARLNDLAQIVAPLILNRVEIFADNESHAVLQNNYPAELLRIATAESFGQEFLDYKISIKTVASCLDAISHIMNHTSGHSEAIIAEDEDTIETFLNLVDAAAVYANASTAFTDGGEFGMGAEIGISTQKLHARGPMGLKEITSYKWLVRGHGQIR